MDESETVLSATHFFRFPKGRALMKIYRVVLQTKREN